MARFNRRTFLQSTSAAAGASLLLTGTKSSGAVLGANERIRIAIAGLNGRGRSHMDGWLGQNDVEIAYLVDPDQNVLDSAMKRLEDKSKGKFACRAVRDIREVLDDPNVDAVS
ncbi:MAG: gfo/Idh/MocA family oxidoreductase, partial [Pirellulaceae bacterium]